MDNLTCKMLTPKSVISMKTILTYKLQFCRPLIITFCFPTPSSYHPEPEKSALVTGADVFDFVDVGFVFCDVVNLSMDIFQIIFCYRTVCRRSVLHST